MRSRLIQSCFRIIAKIWLTIRVHIDAFRANPRAYLIAAKWWFMRKRVRARGQFAPLLGASPQAYRLWILRQKAASAKVGGHGPSLSIIALVDRRGADSSALDATLRSLAADGIPAMIVGDDHRADLAAAAAAIPWDAHPWVMPVNAGDLIMTGATAAYRAALDDHDGTVAPIRLLYADDDLVTRRGRRTTPHFKPDWNSELFRHCDYLTGACIVRVERADIEILAGTADWAPGLVAASVGRGAPLHVRDMLHHRRVRSAPRAILPAVARGADLPPVTVIVPTRNHVALLRTCLDGLAATDYPLLDVIVVDNDSDDPETLAYLAALDPTRYQVLRHSGSFNYSAINNRAAAQARGKLLCLLNNDIEILEPHWLAKMATQALRDDVGAVGARLLYPDGRIQHAGVVIGVGGGAAHAHRFIDPDQEGYFHRHALPQFTSAVTGACLVVQRDRFMAVGGLDEQNFAVAFNDVDLCLRLNLRGWQSLYEPRATLIHHESVSRGFDQDPVGAARFAGELAALKRIWKTDEIFDPFHHPQLSRVAERFAVAL